MFVGAQRTFPSLAHVPQSSIPNLHRGKPKLSLGTIRSQHRASQAVPARLTPRPQTCVKLDELVFEARLGGLTLDNHRYRQKSYLSLVHHFLAQAAIRSLSQGHRAKFHIPKILFIWVPKNAGTSIFTAVTDNMRAQKYLYPRHVLDSLRRPVSADVVTLGHMSSDFLVNNRLLSREQIESLASMGVVRNPFSRFNSGFRYLRRLGVIKENTSRSKVLDILLNGADPVGPYNNTGISHLQPMTSWLMPKTWNGPKDILRFETIESDFAEWSSKFGPAIKLPQVNKDRAGQGPSYQWSPSEVSKIVEFYKSDFQAFGYSENPPKIL